MDIDARAFGQLEGEVKALHAMLTEQNKTLAALTVQLDIVNKTLAEAKGGWKTLVWLGGSAGVMGGFVTWIATNLPFHK
jgi:hypothetical protein